jgi:hypothetical protein
MQCQMFLHPLHMKSIFTRFESNCICLSHSCHQNVDVSLCNRDICTFVDIIITDPTHVKALQ